IVSLAMALLVNAKTARWKPLFRTIYFAPVVTTVVAVAVVWKYLYHPKFGLFNRGLELLHIPPIDFLGDPHWAMPAIILLSIWKNFGYTMIIFVAALQAIPEELYEAARIDGANAIQQFRHVTLPMLGPTFVFVGIITALLVITALLTVMPLVWMISASLMPTGEATLFPPRFLPSAPTIAHYRELFTRMNFGRSFTNSMIIAAAITLFSLFLNSMAGY